MPNRYKAFFAAYKKSVARGNPMSRQEVISEFTDGKTESLKDLSDFALGELVRRLNGPVKAPGGGRTDRSDGSKSSDRSYPGGEKADKMRKAIISIFYRMDKTAEDAKRWAEKQGVPVRFDYAQRPKLTDQDGNKGRVNVKKRFNEYTKQELFVLIRVAEKVLRDYEQAVRKRISTGR